MTGGLLRFVRKEAEPSGPVDLNALAEEMVQLLSHSTLKGTCLSLRLEASLPTVLGDGAALSHALMNLCVNAVDAMPPGGRLTIRTQVDRRGRVCLSVRDWGTGMAPDVRARALEPFYTTKPMGKGTGLGLSQVATTMKAHQGVLELDSRPGEGTEVTLAFPPSPQAAPMPAAGAPRPLSILVVDDDVALLEALCPLLEGMGHQVRTAQGGRAALRLFQEGTEVDLVLLDLTMPGLGGAETMLRLLELRPGQAILIATGYAEASVAPLLAGHPTVGSIQKPFGLEELERRFAALSQVNRIAV
jgi:CheY-like chemotaxis protein